MYAKFLKIYVFMYLGSLQYEISKNIENPMPILGLV